MAMTHEERLELLKLAREAKSKKRQERLNNEPLKPKGRPKKIQEPVVEEVVEEKVEEPVEEAPPKRKSSKKGLNAPERSLTLPVDKLNADDDMKVVQDVITEYQTQVLKKPKKTIVKKIIYESDSDDEIIEEIEYKKSDKPKKVVKKDTPKQAQKEIISKEKSPMSIANMFFNY
tara:strand:- start:470 stop:991 length:522 start_codon:yes stop_codon:yes gene_type:complete